MENHYNFLSILDIASYVNTCTYWKINLLGLWKNTVYILPFSCITLRIPSTLTLEIIDKITLNFTLVSKHSKKHIVQNHHNFQTLLTQSPQFEVNKYKGNNSVGVTPIKHYIIGFLPQDWQLKLWHPQIILYLFCT